jgi:hypothetical protein
MDVGDVIRGCGIGKQHHDQVREEMNIWQSPIEPYGGAEVISFLTSPT